MLVKVLDVDVAVMLVEEVSEVVVADCVVVAGGMLTLPQPRPSVVKLICNVWPMETTRAYIPWWAKGSTERANDPKASVFAEE